MNTNSNKFHKKQNEEALKQFKFRKTSFRGMTVYFNNNQKYLLISSYIL